MNSVPHRVLLPLWIFEQAAGDEKEVYRLVRRYIWQGYPDYKLIEIKGSLAICKRTDGFL